jgi:hypothetical protein
MVYNEELKTECRLLLKGLSKRIKINGISEIPSRRAILNVISTFSYDASAVGKDISGIQKKLIYDAMESTLGYDVERNASMQGGITTLKVRHRDIKEIASDDVIWLHFSLTEEGVFTAFSEIKKVLADNEMSYQLKVTSTLGTDIIVLGLYTKEDAKKILNACNDNPRVQDHLMMSNPFMPCQYGIGVIKETKEKSYNEHISDLLYNYANSIMMAIQHGESINKNWFSLEDFISYVSSEFARSKEEKSMMDRYLNYQTLLSLNCLLYNASYLEHVEHLKSVEYEKEFHSRYKLSFQSGDLIYLDQDNNEITSESNYVLWLKLQAHACLERMYFEKNNEVPKESNYVSKNLSGYLSNVANCIMDGIPYYGSIGYNDDMIKHLSPYLIAYNAYMNKMATIDEARFIASEFTRKIVNKTKVNGQSNDFYTVGDKIIPSTIPPIRLEGSLVGIEYLDYQTNYCNITILKEDEISIMLAVFLDADKEKLWGGKLPGASLYRAALGQILKNSDNIPLEYINRGSQSGNLLMIETVMKNLTMNLEEPEQKQY